MSQKNKWKTLDGNSPYVSFFSKIHPLSKVLIDYLNENTFPLTAKKGQVLLKPGTIDQHLYLILKGVTRSYIKDGNKQITTWIDEEYEITGSIRTFGKQVPLEEYVEVIEDAELVGMDYTKIQYIYDNYPEANYIGRVIVEEGYRAAEERAYIARIPNAMKKYKRLLAVRPDIINRVQLKYIASYLGMTLETLSRIRNKMKK